LPLFPGEDGAPEVELPVVVVPGEVPFAPFVFLPVCVAFELGEEVSFVSGETAD
jgi:hypothetical protein